MANPERGEVEMVVAGKTYMLRLPMPRLIDLEQEFGREAVWERWIAASKKGEPARCSLVEMQSIFYQALREFHPEMKERSKVGELMGEMDDRQLRMWRVLVLSAFKTGRGLVPKGPVAPNQSPSTGATS